MSNFGYADALLSLAKDKMWNASDKSWEWLDTSTPPTEEELQNEITKLENNFILKEYQRIREKAYPSIQDQLDMMYHDKINGTSNWQDAIAKVKSDFPKPTE